MSPTLRTLLTLVLCGWFSAAPAQTTGTAAPSVAASAPTGTTSATELPELSAAKQQIRILEAQLQLTREFQASLLDTVYWGLGGVFVLVGLLVGFGWFANFKVYERDKESIRAELLAAASKGGAELNAGLIARAAELERAVNEKTESAAASLGASLAASIEKALAPVRASLNSVEAKAFQLELEGLKAKMRATPSVSIALTEALGLLELCRRRAESEVPDLIKFMLQKLDAGGKFTASEITRVNKLIDELPEHYKALTDRLRTKLVASDIF